MPHHSFSSQALNLASTTPHLGGTWRKIRLVWPWSNPRSIGSLAGKGIFYFTLLAVFPMRGETHNSSAISLGKEAWPVLFYQLVVCRVWQIPLHSGALLSGNRSLIINAQPFLAWTVHLLFWNSFVVVSGVQRFLFIDFLVGLLITVIFP